MWKDFEEKRSYKNILRHLASFHVANKCLVTLDNIIMPLPSCGQSTVCTWHESGLTNKSVEWNVVLEGFKQPWMSNTVYACWIAVWSNIIQVFFNEKWSCDHLGGFV